MGSWAQIKPGKAVQIVNEGKYLIYDALDNDTQNGNQNRTGFRYAKMGETTVFTDYDKGAAINYDLTSGAIWIAEGDFENGFRFKNELTGAYLNGKQTGDDGTVWTVKTIEEDETVDNKFKGTNRNEYTGMNCYVVYNGGDCWNGDRGGMATWSDAHPYQFYTYTKTATANVTYKCVGPNNEDLKTTMDEVKIGEKYVLKAPSIDFYQVVSKWMGGQELTNDTIAAVTSDLEIICKYKEFFPFETTNITSAMTDFPADAKFYKMTIAADKFYIEYDKADPTKMTLVHHAADYQDTFPDSALWCFSGDRTNGFRIYNRAVGVKNILYFSGDPSTELFGDEGSDAFVHMAQLDTIQGTPVGWKLSKGAFDNGYYWGLPVSEEEYKMNKRGSSLAFWTGGADAGSTFTFEYYNAQAPYVQSLKELLITVGARVKTDSINVGNPGFALKADFDAMYVHYQKAKTDTVGGITNELAQADFIALRDAFEVYKSKRNDNIEENVAYTLTNTKGRGSIYYDPESSDIFVWSSGRGGAGPVDSLNACWSVIKSDIEGEYYLYNIGRKQYIRFAEDQETDYGEKTSWRFTSFPAPLTVTYEGDGFVFKPVDDAGKAVSISNTYKHPVITYYASGDQGVTFRLNKKGQMTGAEIQKAKDVLDIGMQDIGLMDAWARSGVLTAGANSKDVILTSVMATSSENEPALVKGMTLNLENAAAIQTLKVYVTTTPIFDGVSEDSKLLVAQVSNPAASADIIFDTNQSVMLDPCYFWVVVDLSATPRTGDKIGASVTTLKQNTESQGDANFPVGNSELVSHINLFDAQTTIFNRGTLNSMNFGTPAIAMAPNGDLIAATDVRYDKGGDLGDHKIDIAVSISKDQGTTWSEPVIILKGDSTTDAGFGYSSPCIAVDKAGGKVRMLVSGGKKALTNGNKNLYLLTSSDNGLTWTEPAPLEVYWEPADDGASYAYLGAITGSGVVLQHQSADAPYENGLAVFPVRTNVVGKNCTYALSESSDGLWLLSNTPVFSGVQNATVQELSDGKLVFTASTSSKNGARQKNVWEPTSVSENSFAMIFGDATEMTLTGSSHAAGLTVDNNGTTILTNIAFNTSKLMLNVSRDNCETWGAGDAAKKELQAKYAGASATVVNGDNGINVFYQTRVLGAGSNALSCIKIPYTYFQSIVDGIDKVESDKVEEGKKDGKVYDALGRQITTPSKGFYIQDGKKYVK